MRRSLIVAIMLGLFAWGLILGWGVYRASGDAWAAVITTGAVVLFVELWLVALLVRPPGRSRPHGGASSAHSSPHDGPQPPRQP